MFSGRFFIAVLIITVAITCIQWFFIGFLFHKYQAATPATWRKESNRSYAASSFISFCFACMFTIIFSLWKDKFGTMYLMDGVKFGVILWLTFSLTTEVGNAIYVNYSRMFVAGKCLSSLVEYIAAGLVAAALL